MYLNEVEVSPSMHLAIVDGDMLVLRSLSRLLSAHGHMVTAFQSADAFVESLSHGAPDALLVDMRPPRTADGHALLDQLRHDGHRLPVVLLSEEANTTPAVFDFDANPADFLETPCDEGTLLDAIAHAFDIARQNRGIPASSEELRTKWLTLTPREQQVCSQVVRGRLNKQIAADLGTREKTIKVHRARVMAKMGVRSVSELARSIDRLKDAPAIGMPPLSTHDVDRHAPSHAQFAR